MEDLTPAQVMSLDSLMGIEEWICEDEVDNGL
jgi:hypothetical protein